MDLSIDRAVDDPGLEAGVLMAKAYRRRHCDAVGDRESLWRSADRSRAWRCDLRHVQASGQCHQNFLFSSFEAPNLRVRIWLRPETVPLFVSTSFPLLATNV